MSSIVAIQTNSSDDVDGNLTRIDALIDQAINQSSEDASQAKVIVLPECFGFIQSGIDQLLRIAEVDGQGEIQEYLSDTAKKNNIWVIGGSVPLQSDVAGKVSNSLLVYDHHGKRVARYDKVFLFDVELASGERYCESDYTIAGNQLSVIDTPLGKIGLSICYDLRFPELYRQLVERGAQILVVPSAFAYTTGKDHWLPLLTARAIENACYVVAPAQYGLHNNKRKTWGHTVIIDPWGNVTSALETGWGMVESEIDLSKLSRIREQLPSLRHRRPDLF